MFQNLKQHIRKQNLKIIKTKARYIEDEIQQQLKPSINLQKRQIIEANNEPSDSLSDYQILQRQQAFNILLGESYDQQKIRPKSYIMTPSTGKGYFTPQSRVKSLQKSLQLSLQKQKLNQQYHLRELNDLKQKHQREIQQKNIEIQKIQILLHNSKDYSNRLKDVNKQNINLRQNIQTYQEKYWQACQTQKHLINEQAYNKIIKAENQHIKNQNHSLKNQILKLQKQRKQKTQLQKQPQIPKQDDNQRLIQKIKNLQKKIATLQSTVQMQIRNNQQAKQFYQRKMHLMQEDCIKLKREGNQSRQQIQSLKLSNQMLQKSLLQTMNSFSKHLNTSSFQTQHQKHNTSIKLAQPVRTVQKKSNRHETTLDLEEIRQYQAEIDQDQGYQEKQSLRFSPIKQNKQRNKIIQPSLRQQIAQRTRIMSYQGVKNILHNTPAKYENIDYLPLHLREFKVGLNSSVKIKKLQDKLQQANVKIVQLLQQKVGLNQVVR